MIVVTTDTVEGKRIVEVLGLAKGNAIRARHLGRDIVAALRGLVGGEIKEYTQLLSESREYAIARMVQEAERMGANAIVGFRLSTSVVMSGASEILAYGTAVRLE